MYICCLFFFKLPHSFDVSRISLLLFGLKVGLQISPETQFSYQKGRGAGFVLHYILLWHCVARFVH